MLPEDETLALGRRALALWRDLGSTYQDLERSVEAGELDGLAALGHRTSALERELAPILPRMARARAALGEAAAGLAALWQEIDAVTGSVAERHAALLERARTARDDLGTRLGRVRRARDRVRSYVATPSAAPRFTSRMA